MKIISNLLAMFIFTASVLFFVSCNDGNAGGKKEKSGIGEFIEVTIDGKTTKKSITNTFVSSSGEWSFIQISSIDNIYLSLSYYRNLTNTASISPGNYRLSPSSDVQIFDLYMDVYDENYNVIRCVDGTHTVTSVKQSSKAVWEDGNFTSEETVLVEGNFNASLKNGSVISGKYRISLY